MNTTQRQDYINLTRAQAAVDGYDICQPKLDGIWSRVEINTEAAGEARFYSREGALKATYAVSHEQEPARIIGEFMFGSNWSQHEARKGKLIAFDYVHEGAVHLSYRERLAALTEYIKRSEYGTHEWLQRVVTLPIADADSAWQTYVVEQSFEGLCFRKSDDPWDAIIAREKAKFTMDYVITGMEEGTGKIAGMCGKLQCSLWINGELKPVMNCGGGMSNEDRRALWAQRTTLPLERRVLEISGFQIFPSGALRHPNVVKESDQMKWRTDKRPQDCKWNPATGQPV